MTPSPTTHALSIIVLVTQAEDYPALESTLSSLDGVAEVIIADTTGMAEVRHNQAVKSVYLPLPGEPETVLKQRSVLRSSQPWVLFLRPGEALTPAWMERVSEIVSKPSSYTPCYLFPVLINWEGVSWAQSPGESEALLVEKLWYLDHPVPNIKPVFIETPLTRTLPANGLSRWLDQSAEYMAQLRLREQGVAMIQRDLFPSWLKETAGRSLMDGVVRGHFFRDRARRIPLFIAMVQSHLTWLKLYAYTREGGEVAGLLPAR